MLKNYSPCIIADGKRGRQGEAVEVDIPVFGFHARGNDRINSCYAGIKLCEDIPAADNIMQRTEHYFHPIPRLKHRVPVFFMRMRVPG